MIVYFFNNVIDQRICRHYYSCLNTQITTHCMHHFLAGVSRCWSEEGRMLAGWVSVTNIRLVSPVSVQCPPLPPGESGCGARSGQLRPVILLLLREIQSQPQLSHYNRVKIAAQVRRTFLIMFNIRIIAENITKLVQSQQSAILFCTALSADRFTIWGTR